MTRCTSQTRLTSNLPPPAPALNLQRKFTLMQLLRTTSSLPSVNNQMPTCMLSVTPGMFAKGCMSTNELFVLSATSPGISCKHLYVGPPAPLPLDGDASFSRGLTRTTRTAARASLHTPLPANRRACDAPPAPQPLLTSPACLRCRPSHTSGTSRCVGRELGQACPWVVSSDLRRFVLLSATVRWYGGVGSMEVADFYTMEYNVDQISSVRWGY